MSAITRTVAAAAVLFLPRMARAQSVPAPGIEDDPTAICYRFAFGKWTPPLDRAEAGHDPAARGGPGAPNGRDWAVSGFGGGATLMLFPAWWPAGVTVKLDGPPPVVGDTARGTATALVADGRKSPPVAPIAVLGVPCGRAGSDRP